MSRTRPSSQDRLPGLYVLVAGQPQAPINWLRCLHLRSWIASGREQAVVRKLGRDLNPPRV
jgi:hypothetical protein